MLCVLVTSIFLIAGCSAEVCRIGDEPCVCSNRRLICLDKNEEPGQAFSRITQSFTAKNVMYELIQINFKRFELLPDYSFSNMAIRKLNLNFNQMEIIEDNAFNGITGLEELYLKRNKIKTLTSFARSLSGLNTLDLSRNMITSIVDVNSIIAISTVDLSGNELEFLDLSSLQNDPSTYWTLILRFNTIKSIWFSSSFSSSVQMSYNSLAILSTSTFYNFSLEVQELSLDHNEINKIELGTFIEGSKLSSLDLSYNNLTYLEPNIFRNLSRLGYLNINYNNIYEIKLDHFNGLRNMRYLELTGNLIYHIDNGSFDSLESLNSLYLNNNDLRTLEDNLFAKLENLGELVLDSNYLTEVRFEFRYLTNLNWLNLRENQITSIQENCFVGLTSLETVYLDNNKIPNLTENMLIGAESAQRVFFSDNHLEILKNGTFTRLNNALRLYLDKNQISEIEPDAFKGLVNLNKLDLRENLLTRLDREPLRHLSRLKELYLQKNKIVAIDQSAFDSTLTDLDLSQNKLSSVKAGLFKNLTRLQNLNLSRNQISNLELGSFLNCKELTVLDLSGNCLFSIQKSYFNGLVSLERLLLNSNVIYRVLMRPFNDTRGLKELALSNNKLTEFNFSSLAIYSSQIENIDLSMNRLVEIYVDSLDESLFINLTCLNLSYNDHIRIPAGMKLEFPKLEYLYLRSTSASLINLFNLSNIKYLDVSNIQIDDYTFSQIPLDSMEIVNLENTGDLIQLPNISMSPTLKQIDLSNTINSGFSFKSNKFGQLKLLKLSNSDLPSEINSFIDFYLLPELYYLDMSLNSFKSIKTSDFLNNYKMEFLNLSYNRLTEIEDFAFDSQTQLETLDLSHNNLSVFGFQIFRNNLLSWLDKLILDHNRLKSIDVGFACISVSRFSGAYNNFNIIPGSISSQFEQILDFDLSNNNLEFIREVDFSDTYYVYFLNFSFNQISQIESKAFAILKYLIELDLSHNNISDLDEKTFDYLGNLEYLDISYNALTFLNQSLFEMGLQNLVTLDVSFNNIKTIEPTAFLNLRSLKYLYMYDNLVNNLFSFIDLYNMTNLAFICLTDPLYLDQNVLERMTSMLKGRPVRTILNTTVFYSSMNIIVLRNQTQTYSSNDCVNIVYLIKNMISMNMDSDLNVDKFLNECKEWLRFNK